ncbi:hypothetical protein ACG2LH_01525 [Zhouia sp. PK063]|uniref:hypothetical protein n=1 Tax=Zhouia sp. PK063 TaxID=3373602 RepID=UPI0037BA892F
MKNYLSLLLLVSVCYAQKATSQTTEKQTEDQQKTVFQTSSKWMPEIDIRSDVAIIYGANDYKDISFTDRVKSWRDKGYETEFMTGIAWGDYKDYYLGKWDGKNHLDVAQVPKSGNPIMHGKLNPYVVPVASFIKYMQEEVVKKVIDNGITTIFLEEPEFWARSGYSEPFKEEWQKYYGFAWKPQDASPENTYLSNKLKYHLYYNAIKQVSEYAKKYGKEQGKNVKVFIPTHSLVNYTAWNIVSPEASLASLPSIDGYIAQVWTGTSRSPNFYNGKAKERVFENAFLEYNAMVSMTEPTHRKVYLLTDPIEDRKKDWADYKRNYEATFTAEILFPTIANFEVMPWPKRIYTKPYKTSNEGEEALIPNFYSTQMQVMINSLNALPKSENKVTGSQGIGVMMANSMMFQRFPTHESYKDTLTSNFYGQTMPLIKRGVPLQIVHIENLKYDETLKNIKVLVMSYANMKPLSKDSHQYLANWVKKGGVLVYCGADNDPYQQVKEWWNSDGNNYKAPSEHLFKLLNISPIKEEQKFKVGKGAVYVIRKNPKEFVQQNNGDIEYLNVIKSAYENDANAGKLQFKNNFYLERGPYDIAAVMNESVSNSPLKIKGPVIDLYDPNIPVLDEKIVYPGSQTYLFDLKREQSKSPKTLAAAARIYDETIDKHHYSFTAKSPAKTINAMQILLPSKPESIVMKDSDGKVLQMISSAYNKKYHTLFLKFNNAPAGVNVAITF